MKKLVWSFCTLALVACITSPTLANNTAYSNLGSPPSYQCCFGWSVSGAASSNGLFRDAMQFTSLLTGKVAQIDLGLTYLSGTNAAQISLWTSVGDLPSTLLGAWIVDNQPPFTSTSTQLTTILVQGITITKGSQYFLVAEAASDTYDGWEMNDQGMIGLVLQDQGAGWYSKGVFTNSAFDVQTTPEPSTLLLFGTGFMGVLGVARRKVNL